MSQVVRVISIMQPWAWLIVNGFKDVENRTQRFSYRGPVLIHAGKKWDTAGADWLRERDLKDDGIFHAARIALFRETPPLPRGGIVGSATITDCVREHSSPWFFGPHGLLLADQKPLPFYPCRGQLGIYRMALPPELAALLNAVRA